MYRANTKPRKRERERERERESQREIRSDIVGMVDEIPKRPISRRNIRGMADRVANPAKRDRFGDSKEIVINFARSSGSP
jgi:hypothetical protein